MAGRIPEHFIDELMRRVDIVDVIGSRVQIKRAGREYSGLCPFHDERTPSFTVSPNKQFYHCFGCGAHGTALRFLMEYEGLEFVDAIEELAGPLGLEVPREGGQREVPRADFEPLYTLMEASARLFRTQLRSSELSLRYIEQRGLDPETVERFGLGFSGSQWDQLLRALGSDARDRERLIQLGMLISGDHNKLYDRFRDRLMFPIHDRRGRVIAFGGRVIGEGTPKYLNSPETPLFHKGRELYGLHLARQSSSRGEALIVVEGYMDVIALAQHGVSGAVATLGTATTREHAELLFRSAPEVVFCFDGDRAGRQAAWRAVESVLPRMRDGRSARFLFLPDGEDPDTLVRNEGEQGFRERMAQAEPLSEFFFRHHLEDTGEGSMEARARLAENVRPMLAAVPDGTFRDLMLERLNELARITVRVDTPQQTSERLPRPQRREGRPPGLIRATLARLVQYPRFAVEVQPPLLFAGLDQPGIGLLVELVELCRELCAGASEGNVSSAVLIERYRDREEQAIIVQLANMSLLGDEAILLTEFLEALQRLGHQALEQRLNELTLRQASGPLQEHEKEELRELFRQRSHNAEREPG